MFEERGGAVDTGSRKTKCVSIMVMENMSVLFTWQFSIVHANPHFDFFTVLFSRKLINN